MGALTGITMNQKFNYRGDPEEIFSNTYHFRDAPPSTTADWDTLAAGLATIVKAVLPTDVHIVSAYGYNTDDDKPVSVYSKDFTTSGVGIPGTFNPTPGEPRFAGDQAAHVNWALDVRDSRGHYIYCRKYMHCGFVQAGNTDSLSPTYVSALNNFATALGSPAGGFHGGLRSRKHDAPVLSQWATGTVTTRTLKRRGKRPLAHA
jgi:hypothetical protein